MIFDFLSEVQAFGHVDVTAFSQIQTSFQRCQS